MTANTTPTAAEVVVNTAGLTDLDAITTLFLGYLEYYQAPAKREHAKAFLAARLEREQSIIMLARTGIDEAGFAQVYPSFSSVRRAPVWILNDLYVRPESRRLGIGRALMRAVVDLARAAGAVRVELSTAEDNRSAQALYEAEGFTTGHPVRHYTRRIPS